jgi:opacity protein-like surface antigen
LGYWSKSEGDFGVEASVRDVSIGARAKYMFHVKSKVQPYAGAGLGLHFFNTKVVFPDVDMGGGNVIPGFTAEDSATKLGFDLGGGVSTPLSPKTDLFADLWYTLADIDQFSMKVGVSFLLSR